MLTNETLTVHEVAKRLSKRDQFVRELLKRKMVSWGLAMESNGRWQYLIIAEAFEKYMKGENNE